MAINDKMVKRISKATPTEYADIIMDLNEIGHNEEATLLGKALNAYNKFQNIVRFGGDKEKRDMHMAEFETYLAELAEKLFYEPETFVASTTYKKFNQTLNKTLAVFKEAKKDIDLKPTDGMVKAAQRGLDLRKEFGRGGTEVGVARARDIVNRKNLSPQTVKRMYSFFSRHGAQKVKGWKPGEEGYPSAQFIAWLLWGGDPGFSWATKKRNQLEKQEESIKKALNAINENTITESNRQLLFSSDYTDYYLEDEQLVNDYLDSMWDNLDLEEEQDINPQDFLDAAIDWAYDWVSGAFRDDYERVVQELNFKYENFKVKRKVCRYDGCRMASEKVYNIKEFLEEQESKYRSLDHIRGYLSNGKLTIEFQHHDATDAIEIIALNENLKPIRISLDL